MYHITLSEEIKRLCPAFQGVAVMAQVTNSAHNAELWREIDAFTRELRAGETAESIKQQPAIAAKPTSVAAKIPAVTVLPPKHCAAVLCGGSNCTKSTRW
mgnify:CR=1 FL=1